MNIETDKLPRRSWMAMSAVFIGVFMVYVDLSIVFVALPTLERSPHATFSTVEWVVAGYQLGYATVLLAGGRLGDVFGTRSVFVAGMVLFTATSVACGLAPNSTFLDIARAVQGIGAGLLYPQVLPIVRALPSENARRRAVAGLGATIGVALITGPLLGGSLIALKLGGAGGAWRPIFLVNVIPGTYALIAGYLSLPKPARARPERIDIMGLILVSASLFFVVLPLVQAPDSGWHASATISFGLAIEFLAAFWWWQRREHGLGREPLVDPALATDPGFTRGVSMTFSLFFAVPALFFILTLSLQFGTGLDPFRTGLTTLPYAIGTAVGAGLSMRYLDRLGKRALYAGCVCLIAGGVDLALVSPGVTATNAGGRLIFPLLICGLGVGATVAPVTGILLASMRISGSGSASGIITAAQQVAAALGIAVFGSLLFSVIGGQAHSVLDRQLPQLETQLEAAGIPPDLASTTLIEYRTCITQAAGERDLASTPASCQVFNSIGPGDGKLYTIKQELTSAGAQAKSRTFGQTTEIMVGLDILLFLVALGFAWSIPQPDHERLGESVAI